MKRVWEAPPWARELRLERANAGSEAGGAGMNGFVVTSLFLRRNWERACLSEFRMECWQAWCEDFLTEVVERIEEKKWGCVVTRKRSQEAAPLAAGLWGVEPSLAARLELGVSG